MKKKELQLAICEIALSNKNLNEVCIAANEMSKELRSGAACLCRMARLMRNIAKKIDYAAVIIGDNERATIEKKRWIIA